MYIVEFKINAARGDPRGDLKIWTWLRTLLVYLGTDGMSSEDSSIEGLEKVYRVKILLWRRDIDKYLDLIDNERGIADQKFAEAGSKPIRRIRHVENQVSNRKPAIGLPKGLYNDDWLGDVESDYLELTLNVSGDQFEWINFRRVDEL